MAKNSYEYLMVLNTKNGEESWKAVQEKMTSLISANGTVDKVDEWGKRKLAYEIADETEGVFVLVEFTSEPSFVAELDRVSNITDGLLRTMITKKPQ